LIATGRKAKPSLPEKREQELSCDVLVVGAGFSGLVTALRALEQRAKVIVIDKQPRGWWTPGGNMIISPLTNNPGAGGRPVAT